MELGGEGDEKKWIHDSSVDYKGRVPLRTSTGGWRASLFVIGIEFAERLSYYGIASNLIMYLTTVLQQDLKTSAKNVNDWLGVTAVSPLLGGFLADAYIGRFWMVVISSLIYLMGLCLLTLSEFVPSLKPPTCSTSAHICNRSKRPHENAFFLALYLISLGTGGHKPSLESFGADQFDDDDDGERKKKTSFFNWWYCGLCSGAMLGVTLIVYIQDNVGWGAGFVALTAVKAVAIVILIIGVPFYRYRVPKGSPLIPMLQVLTAAIVKRDLTCPSDPSQLYELVAPGRRRLHHTQRMRFLDKAAIIPEEPCGNSAAASHKQQNPWRLATVTQVEETKQLLSMVPIWLSNLIFGVSVVQGQTFFIKQGSVMNRSITPNFSIPPASLLALAALSMAVFVSIYDRLLVPALRCLTGNDRGITILQRIGIGMAFSVACLASAATVEKKRRDSPLPISVFWLAPQFTLLGISDVFTLVGLQEYFYDQVPDNMRSLGIAFYLSVIGAASFLSSFIISVVDSMTSRGGASWFAKDLNHSRLDYFYWLLAVLSGINLCVYVCVARKYSYKSVDKGHKWRDSLDDATGDELKLMP
ncbi:protein NRT1/ PTR FAMILY 5.6-like [Nymphaea colorata]|nr:protein NRT1/ PTR FAMILY 5.6-like [Nymphaea colorata]